MLNEKTVNINTKMMSAGISDPAKSAKAINLVYVKAGEKGYTRKRKGKSFIYFDGNKKLKNKDELERIKKLILPPAWENVWICRIPNGHLQATGVDKLGRKQYKYHNDWSLIRNRTKFYRLYEFGKNLPHVRSEIQKKLSSSGNHKEKILAALLSIMEMTSIRIGNSFYEKLYGSFGLTTLKNRHVNISGAKIKFSFKGKKGVEHNIKLNSRRLAKIIKSCKEIPGKELFEFIDEEGMIHNIDSGMVNEFIQTLTGGDFTAKDFRTWAGSVQAIVALKVLSDSEPAGEAGAGASLNALTNSEMKHTLPAMYELVAGKLGNTKTVCKKYYVHPVIPMLFENNKLKKYIDKLKLTDETEERKGLTAEEKVLMKMLKAA